MFLIITASKDTYITNKIINNKFRATDANVGRAGTLDLFKLYDESTYISGTTRITSSVSETSDLLLKFDYSKLHSLTSSILDIRDSSFNVKLELFNVETGIPVPRNFNVVAYPLSQSFDEGLGRDVNSFGDVDTTNWLTASMDGNSPVIWKSEGAAAGGLLGSSDIDFITSGNIGPTLIDFGGSQNFVNGTEDLSVDVTKVVSSAMVNDIPNYGFKISFSGSDATDSKTRFAKRFASVQVRNKLIAPRLFVTWNSSIKGDRRNFYFDNSGSLFLRNTVGSRFQNLISDSALTEVTGQNCIGVVITSGNFALGLTGSQHTGSTTDEGMTGLYSASFAISSFNSHVNVALRKFDELTFTETWGSLDTTIGFYTGSFIVKSQNRLTMVSPTRTIAMRATNGKKEYKFGEKVTLRVFVIDEDEELKPYKLPRQLKTKILDEVYFRIKEVKEGKVVVPFVKDGSATRLSSDDAGMFFEFYTDSLFVNRTYGVELLIVDRGQEYIIPLEDVAFRIVN